VIGDEVQATGLEWSGVQHVRITHWHSDLSGSAAEAPAHAPPSLLWVGEAGVGRVQATQPIRPGAERAEVFGLRVVATPGHTLGHISLFVAEMGALFIGDAAGNRTRQLVGGMSRIDASGGLTGALPQATVHMDQSRAGIRRLAVPNGCAVKAG
jgi:glyoxylase-like metal-dependent hydrolase (beta-lactamase superfamily II)